MAHPHMLVVRPKMGGVVVEHHHHDTEPKVHEFDKDNAEAFHAHMAEHVGQAFDDYDGNVNDVNKEGTNA